MAALPPKDLSGRGILFVESRISRPDIIDEATFFNWYDNDHIAEILETGGVKSAHRAIHVDREQREKNGDKPFLALYPLEDLSFLLGDRFRKIRVHSDILPNGGPCYDIMDVDVGYYNLVMVYDARNKGKGHTKTIVTAQIELGDDTTPEELGKWYREEHCPQIAQHPGYLRSTRFKLAYARSNAQSRAFKGLDSDPAALPPSPPAWLTIHEFSDENLDVAALGPLTDTEWTRKVWGGAKRTILNTYKVAKVHGEGEWFQGVEL